MPWHIQARRVHSLSAKEQQTNSTLGRGEVWEEWHGGVPERWSQGR